MKIAFMFPGQGAQFVGMGKDFYETYPEAREVYQKASKVIGKDIANICFNGPIEELSNTKNTQLAISTTSLAILSVFDKYGINAQIEVGLSLGEYVALIHSGILDFNQGIKLLEKRSIAMAEKVEKGSYRMIAIMGLGANKIEEICKQEKGFVVPANYNYSGQVVVTGEEKVIESIIPKLQEAGAKKIVTLNTSGPFHTEKLLEASKTYRKNLEEANFNIIENKVLKNLDGSFYTAKDDIKEILAKHIISPVRFDKEIQKMASEGIDTYIEIGPGKALSGFVRKEIKEAKVYTIQKEEDMQNLLKDFQILSK